MKVYVEWQLSKLTIIAVFANFGKQLVDVLEPINTHTAILQPLYK